MSCKKAIYKVQAVDSYAIHEVAGFAAHSIAHILGIDHDSPDCLCDKQTNCLMNRQLGYFKNRLKNESKKFFSSSGSSFSWQFSKCSSARMQGIFQTGHVQCLLNKPFQPAGLHRCGNNIVDSDEQCDCGPRNECELLKK